MRDNIESRSISPEVIRKELTIQSANQTSILKSYPLTNKMPNFPIIIKEYQENSSKDEQINSNPFIKRFAIDIEETKELINSPITKIALHNIEQKIFEYALEELNTLNTVLVDVFVRDPQKDSNNKEINDKFIIKKDLKTQSTEIHTICLWKKSDSTIVIIDPSNSQFTDYLTKPLNTLFTKTIEIQRHNPQYTNKFNEDKFYCADVMPIGTEKYNSRDCIDIAVKIAFKLIEEIQNTDIINNIQNSIKILSNQQKVNKILKYADNTLIRELQSSSLSKRKEVQEKLRSNEKAMEHISVNTLDDLDLLSNQETIKKIDDNKNELRATGKIPIRKLEVVDNLRKEIKKLNTDFPFSNFQIGFIKKNKSDISDLGQHQHKELISAVKSNNPDRVLQLLEEYNKNFKKLVVMRDEQHGQNALYITTGCNSQSLKIAKILIEYMSKEDIVKADNYGWTVLHHTAVKGNIEVFKLLTSCMQLEDIMKADNVYGLTALHLAAIENNIDIVDHLLNYLKNQPKQLLKFLTIFDNDGMTALHLAVMKNGIDIVDHLLNYLDNYPTELSMLLTTANKNGMTTLHSAVIENNINMVDKLLNALDNQPEQLLTLLTTSANEMTPLVLAIQERITNLKQFNKLKDDLLTKENPDLYLKGGIASLFTKIESFSQETKEIIILLLNKMSSYNINKENNIGITALSLADNDLEIKELISNRLTQLPHTQLQEATHNNEDELVLAGSMSLDNADV